MTTNFPSSIDNFTNPTSSSTMASPSHSAQHADVNDAVEAIETALLDGAPLHVDDANERVGIRTTSPTASLTVTSGTDDAKVKIDSNGGALELLMLPLIRMMQLVVGCLLILLAGMSVSTMLRRHISWMSTVTSTPQVM